MNLKAILMASASILLSACSNSSGFADLDQFMKTADEKPRGQIEKLKEYKAYRAFTYKSAGNRAPFSAPIDVVVNDIQLQEDQSSIKPSDDRPKEVLESFQISQLSMVGTLTRGSQSTLWALISDDAGSIHMAKTGQYMGKNHGRIVDISDTKIDLIEIVPNGNGGWLERPRTVSLASES